ncbi:hypothetical protein MCOR22_004061 [Pyricularia oryzae]|nr:hypothetical protein MCOR22_004061 [Pyricularia oryzae]
MQENDNLYLAYKRNTRYLVQWIVCNYNEILRSSTAEEQQQTQAKPMLSGQVTVKELVAMATRIGARKTAVPPSIFKCIRSVIDARTLVAETYKMMGSSDGDRNEEVEESNASHAFFIQTLSNIFSVLGGDERHESLPATDNDQEAETKAFPLSNMFSNLDINRTPTSHQNSSEEEETAAKDKKTQQRKNRKTGARGKKGQKKNKEDKVAEQDRSRPLKDYKLIELNDKGQPPEYMLAALQLFRDWTELRKTLGASWQAVAQNGLNIAAVGASCHLATALIKQGELAIFVDFPGLETFQNILATITRAIRANPAIWMSPSLARRTADKRSMGTEKELVDTREQFMANVYDHLVDFLADYRHTRSGKPSKGMAAQLRGWNPELNLGQATPEERFTWRRCYTINWLYDLVNFFSSVVVEHHLGKTGKDKSKLALEQVDWLGTGPWFENRKLFGLIGFGGSVTKLAMQNPGAALHEAIAPSLVFQLQCLVDSLMASRGVIYHPFRGAIIREPNPDFRPQRDIEAFLDRDDKGRGRGYLHTVTDLHINADRCNHNIDKLDAFAVSFRDWLGRCPFDYAGAGLPQSRCAADGSYDALWDLSPYLCGAGLLEALDLAQCHFFAFWDGNIRHAMLMHLYNMLKNSGGVLEPVPVLDYLIKSLGQVFFDGPAPSSDFQLHFERLAARYNSPARMARRNRALREANRREDLEAYLHPGNNIILNKAGLVACFRAAGWDVEKISEADLACGGVGHFARAFAAEIEKGLSEAAGTGAARQPAGPDPRGEELLAGLDTARTFHGVMSRVLAKQFSIEDPFMAINWPDLGVALSRMASDMIADVRASHRNLFGNQFRRRGASEEIRGVLKMMGLALGGKNGNLLKTLAESLEKQRCRYRILLHWDPNNSHIFMFGAQD